MVNKNLNKNFKNLKKPNKTGKKEDEKEIPLPKEEVLREIALTLKRKIIREERATKYVRVKEILTLLASGALLATAFIMPGIAKILPRPGQDYEKDWKEWKKFNSSYLRRTLERLKRQKLVEIQEGEKGVTTIKITASEIGRAHV